MVLWKTIKLYDSDGGQPDEEQFVRAMRDYRDNDSIGGYWLIEPSTEPDDEDGQGELYRDPWHNNELRHIWDCGPSASEIDWTGCDEEIGPDASPGPV